MGHSNTTRKRPVLVGSESGVAMRIWIDGCFDFTHHGHAGAILQARQQGDELVAGVHNDAEILHNKGPPVMTLEERMLAVEGCRWVSEAVADAPYVTEPGFMDIHRCQYVVHGDDITTDANGEDCYAEVKRLGRFIVVKRTPGISTTDLVGRMLDRDKPVEEQDLSLAANVEKLRQYAQGPDGKSPHVSVWINHDLAVPGKIVDQNKGRKWQVKGDWDLFHPGHIRVLKQLKKDAGPDVAIVAVINDKAKNCVMSAFERSLCVLQSKYIDAVVIGSPDSNWVFEKTFNVEQLADMSAQDVVTRVLQNRELYLERQRKKGAI